MYQGNLSAVCCESNLSWAKLNLLFCNTDNKFSNNRIVALSNAQILIKSAETFLSCYR